MTSLKVLGTLLHNGAESSEYRNRLKKTLLPKSSPYQAPTHSFPSSLSPLAAHTPSIAKQSGSSLAITPHLSPQATGESDPSALLRVGVTKARRDWSP